MTHLLPLIAPLVYLLFVSELSLLGPALAYCQPQSGPTEWDKREGNKNANTHSNSSNNYSIQKGNEGHKSRGRSPTFVDPAGPSHSYYTLIHQLLNKLLNEYQLTFLTKGQEQYLNHPEELTDDRTKYQATLSNGDINYSPKEGVKVMTVLYDHEPVWSHDPVRDRDEYPLKVVLNFNLGVLSVNTHSRTHLYLFDNNRWVHRLTTDLRPSSTPLLSLDCLYPSGSVQKKEELEEELEELEDEVHQLEQKVEENKDILEQDKEKNENKLEKEEDITGPKELKLSIKGSSKVNDTSKYALTKLSENKFYYEFNRDAKCTKITFEDREVWRHREGSFHPDSVTYNRGERKVTLWFDSDHTSYQMSGDGKWYIGTSTLPLESSQYPPEVTLTTIDSDSTPRDNDTSKFAVYKFFQSTYTYSFNSGVTCTRITHQGKEVWNSTNNYRLDSFKYNSNNQFTLFFGLDQTVYRLNKEGKWEATFTTLSLGVEHPEELRVITQDQNGRTKVNDTTVYTLTKFDEDTFEYVFNSGSKCVTVECEKKEVWSRRPGFNSPDSLVYNKRDKELTLWFEFDHTTYRLSGNGEWETTSSALPLNPKEHPEEVKIITEDNGGRKKENETSLYWVFKEDLRAVLYTYKFFSPARCTKITHEGKLVWTSTADLHLDSFIYNKTEKEFTLYFGLDYSKYSFNRVTGKWEEVKKLSPPTTTRNNGADGSSAKTNTQSQPDLKLFTGEMGKLSEMKGDNYSLFNPAGATRHYFLYTFKKDVKCALITCHGKEVWRYESGLSYPASLSYNSRDDSLILYFADGIVMYSMGKEGMWAGRSLDIRRYP